MVKLLNCLQEEAVDMPGAWSFLSSHPLTEERMAKAERLAAQLGIRSSTPAPVTESWR
jgi:predicted Zn-dependent protease